MNEPRTLSLLYELIEKEYAWRITELSNFRNSVLQSKGKAKEGMIKAGIALLYAHWEGFIKKIADKYFEFVSYQNCKLSELNDTFISIVLRGEVEYLIKSNKLKVHNKIIRRFFEAQGERARFSSTSPIRTSNLNYEIFEDVCIIIGIDIEVFEDRNRKKGFDRNFELTINNELLRNRNFIAHGESCQINLNEFKDLYNFVVNGCLYVFKEIVMDSAQNKLYKRENK